MSECGFLKNLQIYKHWQHQYTLLQQSTPTTVQVEMSDNEKKNKDVKQQQNKSDKINNTNYNKIIIIIIYSFHTF